MRKRRLKVLYFTKSAQMSSEERNEYNEIKKRLRDEYDEETVELHVNILNSAVPQYLEKCDFVCGTVPYLFRKHKVFGERSTSTIVKKSVSTSKKKDMTTNVHQ